jgi:hypothetical protein
MLAEVKMWHQQQSSATIRHKIDTNQPKCLVDSAAMCTFAHSKPYQQGKNDEESIEDCAAEPSGTGGHSRSADLDGVWLAGEGRHVVQEA